MDKEFEEIVGEIMKASRRGKMKHELARLYAQRVQMGRLITPKDVNADWKAANPDRQLEFVPFDKLPLNLLEMDFRWAIILNQIMLFRLYGALNVDDVDVKARWRNSTLGNDADYPSQVLAYNGIHHVLIGPVAEWARQLDTSRYRPEHFYPSSASSLLLTLLEL
jgi:hypothetical protein